VCNPTYMIKNWSKNYENHESKKIKNARYVLVPNQHDGKGFRRLMALTPEKIRRYILDSHECREILPDPPDGIRVFAAWILILQVASKCDERGTLATEDGPLTAEDMSYKTGAPESLFSVALTVLSHNDFQWIECVEKLPERENLPELREISGDFRHRTEQNRTNTPYIEACQNLDKDLWARIQRAAFSAFGSSYEVVLKNWVSRYPPEWILDAIVETEANGVRHPNYATKILTHWEEDEKNGRSRNKSLRTSISKSAGSGKQKKTVGTKYATLAKTNAARENAKDGNRASSNSE